MTAAGVLAGDAAVLSAGGASAEELRGRVDELARENAALREGNALLREQGVLLREQNAQLVRVNDELRELVGSQAARLAEVNESLAVLQKMVFGRKSEKNRPEPDGDRDDSAGDGGGDPSGGKKSVKRGPGARSGRRDYSHLPQVEVVWDFPGGGYCCPECGEPFTALGSDHVTEVLDWQVIVRVVVALPAPVQEGVPVSRAADGDGAGPAEGDRQGPVHARVHRDAADGAVRGGPEPELPGDGPGPAGRGDLARYAWRGRAAQAAGAAGPPGGRDRGAEPGAPGTCTRTRRRGGCSPRATGTGPANWWLWVFIGADTVAS